MRKIKNFLYKFSLRMICFGNAILYLFTSKKNSCIYIVSSSKYKNHIKEDLLLQRCFLKNQYRSKIVSWEEKLPCQYAVIRTVWGYHKKLSQFLEYIQGKNTVNPNSVIVDNVDKKKQYALLEEYHISRVSTEFVDDISEYSYQGGKVVVKPIVSASGDDTHLIQCEQDLESCKDLKDIMIQPYIEEIQEGELSIVVIDHEIRYGVIRYPGVFVHYQSEKYVPVSFISSSVLEEVHRILKIPEYSSCVFMRIDFVKDHEDYKVLEVELTDPNLYIETIPDARYKKETYQKIVDATCRAFHLKD